MSRTTALTPAFFNQPTLKIAPKLLGKFLVRRVSKRKISGMITEVEAYVGPEDKASHASRGKTERSKIMFGKGGCWYIHFTYGMHWMLNVVTERDGYPAAVLIRAVDKVCGPGRLTNFFGIDKRFNSKPISKKTGLWIEDLGVRVPAHRVQSGKRIGVDYAGKWKDKLWRFYLK